MRVTFLGTAAAEGYPNPFCDCANCERARHLGGRNLRKRSAALINDDLLIDLGPDLGSASAQHGHSLARVRACLQTHAHADHLDTSHVLSRSRDYGVPAAPHLDFYASAASIRRAARSLDPDFAPASLADPAIAERLNLTLHPIAPSQAVTVGPYQVVAVGANHDPALDPLLFAIGDGARTIFYGTDTGLLPDATWQALRQHRLRFDLVILDHTYGTAAAGSDHLNADQFVATIAQMRAANLLGDESRIFAHHLSHETNPDHATLVAFAAARGYEVAYDGLTLDLTD